MLQYFKDLSIRVKISGFVIPSTLAFGLLMTCLTLYFINDYKTDALAGFGQGIKEMQVEGRQGQFNDQAEALLQKMSTRADEKIRSIAIIYISIVVAVLIMATLGAMIISGLIGKPVQKIALRLENISSGDADLTQRLTVTANDETGKVSRYFNAFLEKLQGIIKTLQGDADQLTSATQSIHEQIAVIHEKSDSAKKRLAKSVSVSWAYE